MSNSKPTELSEYNEPEIAKDVTPPHEKAKNGSDNFYKQFSIENGCVYRAISDTTKILPPGVYEINNDNRGYFFLKKPIDTSHLIRFPDTIADNIISDFNTFWKNKKQYLLRGETHKRGYLLWGPPGGGKSCLISLIIKDFIKQGNVVFWFGGHYTLSGLVQFRRVEKNRKMMIILEDIDSIIQNENLEQQVLQLLDGSHQFSNTIIMGTTNYPENLPDRIINRPSRFDRVEEIGLPSTEDIKLYLEMKSKKLKPADIQKWLKDTKNFTLAHIKELLLAYEVFGLDYNIALERIKKMRKKMSSSKSYSKSIHDENDQNVGFKTRRVD